MGTPGEKRDSGTRVVTAVVYRVEQPIYIYVRSERDNNNSADDDACAGTGQQSMGIALHDGAKDSLGGPCTGIIYCSPLGECAKVEMKCLPCVDI